MPAQRMEAPITVAEAVMAIKSHKYLLPAIQRDFVWKADKTIALFDSLMRGYPVGSFLFWRVDAENSTSFKFYEFMQAYDEKDNSRLKPHDIPTPCELMVALDGQQRLTSLTIGILGYRADRIRGKHANNPNAYPKKRLHLNLAGPFQGDGDLDRVYDFRFLTEAEAAVVSETENWFPIRDVLQFKTSDGQVDLNKVLMHVVSKKLGDFGAPALGRLCQIILTDPVIHYFREDEQSLDRVLNVFVRLNSGGVALSYSDLLLSIASAQWVSDARATINSLVDDLNAQGDGFEFDKDFVLKSALVLSDLPDIGFSVENFGKKNTEAIETGWETNVRAPLLLAVEVAAALGYQAKTLTSNNVLVPLAYYLRKIGSPAGIATSPKFVLQRIMIRKWLIASLLKGVFSAKTDTVLSAVRTAIRDSDAKLFPIKDIEAALNKHGVSLRFTDLELEAMLESEYGKRNAFSVLAALYPGLSTQFRFHMDHLFPKAGFHKNKLRAAGLDEAAIDRVQSLFNQIPNLQLLEGLTNQSKLDSPFETWIEPLRAKPADWAQYCGQHLVPEMGTYSIAQFEAFFEARRALMFTRLREKLAGGVSEEESETTSAGAETVEAP